MSIRRASSSRSVIRRFVLAAAERVFRKLFGVPYQRAWGASVRARWRDLQRQDTVARTAAANIRRSPNRARALVRSFGLASDPYRPGTAPALAILASVTQGSKQEMKAWVLSEDTIASEKPFASLRTFVVRLFEVLPATSERTGSFADLGLWKRQGYNDARVLTDAELVAIFICLDERAVNIGADDLQYPPADAARRVRDRERREMKKVRKKYGLVEPPRTRKAKAEEAKKKAILPTF